MKQKWKDVINFFGLGLTASGTFFAVYKISEAGFFTILSLIGSVIFYILAAIQLFDAIISR
jgi:hypothetical protein